MAAADSTPAMPAPHGQHSQLSNPPSKNYPVITCLVLAVVLSALAVTVRIYTRQRITRKLWWDDWTCILGWVFLVAMAALLLDSLNYGGGSDLWNVSEAKYAKFKDQFHNVEIVARVGMFFTKASILLFYQRLFVPSGVRWTPIWWSIWFVFWWNLLYAIALVLTVAFECVGKDDVVAAGGQCVNEYAVLIGASVINVTTDLMILVIPIAAIWGLHMPAMKKWRLSAIFAVGTLGVAASVARLAYQIPEAKKPNQTIIVMILSLMNTAEQFIGIVVSCMPILPAFYRHMTSQHPSLRYSGSSGLKEKVISSVINRHLGRTKRSADQPPKDPYQVESTRGYTELNESETGSRPKLTQGQIVRDVEMKVISEPGG